MAEATDHRSGTGLSSSGGSPGTNRTIKQRAATSTYRAHRAPHRRASSARHCYRELMSCAGQRSRGRAEGAAGGRGQRPSRGRGGGKGLISRNCAVGTKEGRGDWRSGGGGRRPTGPRATARPQLGTVRASACPRGWVRGARVSIRSDAAGVGPGCPADRASLLRAHWPTRLLPGPRFLSPLLYLSPRTVLALYLARRASPASLYPLLQPSRAPSAAAPQPKLFPTSRA